MALPWHLYLMASLYILAGLNHFRVPRLYARMVPPLFPAPKLLNIISGAVEIILGIMLCIPQFSHIAAWGIILLLLAVFPANIYMYANDKAGMGLPKMVAPIKASIAIGAYLLGLALYLACKEISFPQT